MNQKNYTARQIQKELNYVKWENFNGLIKRAINLINSGIKIGVIKESHISIETGKGAIRKVKDYILNDDALILIKELALSYKTANFNSGRNETLILSLVEKYFNAKKIEFVFQKRIQAFVFDAFIANKLLIEFDEFHHQNSNRQKIIDSRKNKISADNNLKLIRLTLNMDIIDCIIKINSELYTQGK